MHTLRNRRTILFVAILISALWVQHSRADAPPGQYQVTANAVYDTKSTLTWQRDAAASASTWTAAQTYCQNLMLDGSGWRIPSMKEIMTIVDDTKLNPPVDASAFPNAPTGDFWTSSMKVGSPNNYWYVTFYLGETGWADAQTTRRVRCVR